MNDAIRVVLVAAGYYGSARLGYLVAVPHGYATLWAPSGLMLALLLLSPRREWPTIVAGGLIGSVLSDLQSNNTLTFALMAALANGLETLVAAWFVEWRLKRPISLDHMRDVGELVIGAAVVSNAVTAFIGTIMLHGIEPKFLSSWLIWWVSDGLGMLIVAPLVIAIVRAAQLRRWPRARMLVEALLVGALLIFIAESVFGSPSWAVRPGAYATFPFMLWAGLRFGPLGGTVATFIVAAIATWNVALGYGPFASPALSGVDAALQVYAYLAVSSLCALIPAAAFAERAHAARAQGESENRYRAVVETATDAIVTINEQSIIEFANPAVRAVFGYDPEELIGKPLTILMPAAMADRHNEGLERYLATGRRNIEWSAAALPGVHKDGRAIPLEVSFGERVIGTHHLFTGIIRDVTEKHALEEQYRQSQKLEAIGQLAGGVAHDFNNLLTAIKGYAFMLSESLAPEGEQQDDVREILRAADRATSLTAQLLAFSRRQVIAPRTLNVSEAVREVEPMLRRLIGEDIDLMVLTGEDVHVRADPAQIEQVILNLALNARDAMPQGGRLVLETGCVQLDAEHASHHGLSAGRYATIVAADSGTGMDAVTAARVFEPFFTTKPVGKGTGLGLSTVYGIAQQFGGMVVLQSERGHGATFTVYLPQIDAPEVSPAADSPPRGHGGPECILLLEDDEVLRKMTHRILEKASYRVVAAAAPSQAFDLAATQDGRFDLLLTDVVLPEMSGRAFAEQLRTRFPDIKVIYMSGYTHDSVMQRGVLEGETTFIQKPFSQDTLLSTLRRVLDG